MKDFDLKTHVRDPKSGRVIKVQPYKLIVAQKEGGGSEWLFERPVGSGIYFYANGEIAEERSKEGLAKLKREEDEKSKSELQKAEEQFEASKKAVEMAKAKHAAEEAKKAKLSGKQEQRA